MFLNYKPEIIQYSYPVNEQMAFSFNKIKAVKKDSEDKRKRTDSFIINISMKIYFYVLTSFPYGMAAGRRRLCYAKGLIASGNEVEIIICQRTETPISDDGLPPKGIYNGIKYNYINGKIRNENKILQAILSHSLYYFKAFYFTLKNIKKGEIIYCYFYSVFLHFLLICAAKIKGAKVVRELCEHPYVIGKQNKMHKLSCWVELHLIFPLFDGFIPISEELQKLANNYKSKKAKTILVPILVENQKPNFNAPQTNIKLNNPYIIHTGTMDEEKDGISDILKAFSFAIKDITFPIDLVFAGPDAIIPNKYEALINKLKLSKSIKLIGMVKDPIALSEIQKKASLAIINRNDNLQNRSGFSTKLGEMLINEVPVITTTIGDAKIYLKDNQSAYFVEPGKYELIAEKIIQAFMNPEERIRIGKEGKKIAEKYFDPISEGQRLSNFYHQILHV